MKKSYEDTYMMKVSDKARIGYFTFEGMDYVFVILTYLILQSVLELVPYMPFWGPQIVPIVLIAVLLYRIEDGRLYYVVGNLIPGGFWIWNKRDKIWEAPEENLQKTKRRNPKRLEQALEERRAALKFKVDGIQTGNRTLGILHNKKTKLDTFVIVGDGSPFALQELLAKMNEVIQHGEVIKRNAITPLFKVRWSYVFQRSPLDMNDILDTYQRSLDPRVYFPPSHLKPESEWTMEDRVDRFLNEVAKASLADADAVGGNVTMAIVVTIERRGALYGLDRKNRKVELKDDELARTPVLELEQGIVSDLAHIAKVKNPRSLTQQELALYMRESWDVTDIKKYYRMFHKNERGELNESERRDFAISHWPSSIIKAGSGFCQMDNTHMAIIKIRSNPQMIPPDFWHRIMKVRYTRQARPVWITVAFCGETVSLKGESLALSRGIPLLRAFRSMVMNSAYQSQESKDRDRSLVDRHTTIYRDQNYQLANMRLIKIRATDKASLEQAIHVVRIEMAKEKLQGRVIKRRKLQLPAVWSAAGIPLL